MEALVLILYHAYSLAFLKKKKMLSEYNII